MSSIANRNDPDMDLYGAAETLGEIEEELLFLTVAIANTWDDNPAYGCVLILERLRARLKAASGTIAEAIQAPAEPTPPQSPPFDPTPKQQAVTRKFIADWDAAGRDAEAQATAAPQP